MADLNQRPLSNCHDALERTANLHTLLLLSLIVAFFQYVDADFGYVKYVVNS